MLLFEEFYRYELFSVGFSSSFITLIPNRNTPVSLNDYRPISHLNWCYKLVAKVLMNRMKMIVGRLIYDTQSAFVHNQQITDEVLLTCEIIDELKKKRKEVF